MNKKSSRQKNSNQDNCKEDNNIYSEESDSETNKKLTKDQIIEQLRNEIVSINDEKTQLQQVAQRSQADLINYKNRTEQEKTDIREKSKHNIILKLITVVDDVERAIASLPKNSDSDVWQTGIELIQKTLVNALESEGVSKINPLNQTFDPFTCEAILYQETKNATEGQVIEVIRTGYMINEKILRPAQVVVAQNETNKNQEENNNA
ncbi:MAG: nucleotide exchange factor GrpE [Chloroflexi bacterium]|nr:nucleotide exchange factor GrpE [Chloroflexota bacterium]|tara:strand:+ start:41848 stop:42468 length:621 start_codon:yes stop_codon:yes gene_type:complete